jgi:hypothetical protein
MLMNDLMGKLEIVPLKDLIAHEQTIEKNVRDLKEVMLNIGRLVDPLIVDKGTKIVLDGTHRRRVLELLDCVNIPCQIVDYNDDGIKIGGWFIAMKDVPLGLDEFKAEEVDYSQGIRDLNSMSAYFMLVEKEGGRKKCKIFNSNEKNLWGNINEQNALISKIENSKVYFVGDDRADELLDRGYSMLFRRIFTKDETVREALAGRPFPPKSTRHMIPGRIIRLNTPLGWLAEDREVVRRLIEDMLKRRAIEGFVRRYTEPVTVIY